MRRHRSPEVQVPCENTSAAAAGPVSAARGSCHTMLGNTVSAVFIASLHTNTVGLTLDLPQEAESAFSFKPLLLNSRGSHFTVIAALWFRESIDTGSPLRS